MAAIDVLDPSGVRRWCAGAVAALAACRAEIDELNVYPVPDGDTGTNLLLTLRAADDAVPVGPAGRPGGDGLRRWPAARCWVPAATPA